MGKLLRAYLIEYDSLEEAVHIVNTKDEVWENIKADYEEFELEYKLSVGEDKYGVEVYIYDKKD